MNVQFSGLGRQCAQSILVVEGFLITWKCVIPAALSSLVMWQNYLHVFTEKTCCTISLESFFRVLKKFFNIVLLTFTGERDYCCVQRRHTTIRSVATTDGNAIPICLLQAETLPVQTDTSTKHVQTSLQPEVLSFCPEMSSPLVWKRRKFNRQNPVTAVKISCSL